MRRVVGRGAGRARARDDHGEGDAQRASDGPWESTTRDHGHGGLVPGGGRGDVDPAPPAWSREDDHADREGRVRWGRARGQLTSKPATAIAVAAAEPAFTVAATLVLMPALPRRVIGRFVKAQ